MNISTGLGIRQQEALVRLKRQGPWFEGAGWTIAAGDSATRKAMESLARAGFVSVCSMTGLPPREYVEEPEPVDIYVLTFSGRMEECAVTQEARVRARA